MYKSASITSEKNVTVDDLLAEAAIIRKEVGTGRDYKTLHTSHKQFMTAYPIVIRYIYEHGMYDAECFRRLIEGITGKISEEDYFAEQARYIAGLYRKIKKFNGKILAKIRSDAYDSLMSEHKKFVSDTKAAQAQEDVNEMTRIRANAGLLKSLASAMPNPNWIENHADPDVTPSTFGTEKAQSSDISSNFADLLDD